MARPHMQKLPLSGRQRPFQTGAVDAICFASAICGGTAVKNHAKLNRKCRTRFFEVGFRLARPWSKTF